MCSFEVYLDRTVIQQYCALENRIYSTIRKEVL